MVRKLLAEEKLVEGCIYIIVRRRSHYGMAEAKGMDLLGPWVWFYLNVVSY